MGDGVGRPRSSTVTDRRSRHEADDLLRSTFASLGEAVFVIDPDGRRIVSCNPAVEGIFGYRPEELVGESTVVLHLSREAYDRFGEASEAVLERDGVFRGAFRMRHRDGRPIETEHTVTPIVSERGWRAGVVSVVRDVTARRRAEEELLAHHERLRTLTSQLSEAEAQERRRVAADLHDRVAQSLAVVRWKLDALADAGLGPDLRRLVDEARGELARSLRDVRSLTFELCPPELSTLGLEAAVSALAERIRADHGLDCRVEDDGSPKPLGPEPRDFLYRAVRELLLNVVKHADTPVATVSIARAGDQIRVEVADEGVGFDPSSSLRLRGADPGFGLFSIRERLDFLGGTCAVASSPGRGTRVTLTAPLSDPAQRNVG